MHVGIYIYGVGIYKCKWVFIYMGLVYIKNCKNLVSLSISFSFDTFGAPYHTGENIYQEYENVVMQFGIDQKVNHVVTDTARNMIKAFKLPGYTEDEDEDEEEEEDCDGQGGEELDIEAETNFPTEHHGCFAHVLQLVVKDGFKVAKQIDNIL